MLRSVMVAALAAIGVLAMSPRVNAGVLLDEVKAIVNGSPVDATAFHGFIAGNDANGDGNPLLRYLNSGTNAGETLTLQPGGQTFTISGSGMFGSTTQTGLTVPGGIIDVVEYRSGTGGFVGFNAAHPWEYLGKSDDPNPPLDDSVSGILTPLIPLAAGSYALSLKAGTQYAVYLFANVGEITSFTFNANMSPGLSHASLYRVDPPGVVPEPASLAVFGLGALLGVGGSLRRRFAKSKGFALSGLAT